MVKKYGDLYLQARRALLPTEGENAAAAARELLAFASGKSVAAVLADANLYASEQIEADLNGYVNRMLAHEPLPYILGQWNFYGISLEVTPDVLIPRDDTMAVTDLALEVLRTGHPSPRVFDLCCGSGCIACAIANELPAARVVAADISPSALEVCRKNIKDNKLTSRIIPMNADATTWPPMSIGSFDVIVSNPPYIPSFELIELDCSVRDYEPMTALDGGEDGLDFYRAIIKYWTITMRPNGLMMFEVGEGQADEVKMMLLKAGFVSVEGRNDTLGFERVVIGKWKNEF